MTADPAIAADLSAVSRPVLAAVVAVVVLVVAALASDPACFVCPVCSSAAATGKGGVAPAAFYFLIHRSYFLRNRNCP